MYTNDVYAIQRRTMTKREQRALITKHGAAQLEHTPLALLKELVSLNWLGKQNPDADAEEEPFRVGIAKISNRAHLDARTVARGLATLEQKGLLTITKAAGKPSLYHLHLAGMAEGPTVAELERKRREAKTEAQTTWQRKARKAKIGPATTPSKETNRERRLRHIRETPALAMYWRAAA
jgi:hypothetical protein